MYLSSYFCHLIVLCASKENDPIIDLNTKQRAATFKHPWQNGGGIAQRGQNGSEGGGIEMGVTKCRC